MAQRGGWTGGLTDGRTDVRREKLPILQDTYWGRCPKIDILSNIVQWLINKFKLKLVGKAIAHLF